MNKNLSLLETVATKSNFTSLKGEELSIRSTIKKDLLNDNEKIVLELPNEFNINIEKIIVGRIMHNAIIVKQNFSNLAGLESLLDTKVSDNKIIITNTKNGMHIQDLLKFKSFNTKADLNVPIYFIGHYENIQIFIDINLSWNDNRLLSYDNNLQLTFIENSINQYIVVSGTSLPESFYSKEFILKLENINAVIDEFNEIY